VTDLVLRELVGPASSRSRNCELMIRESPSMLLVVRSGPEDADGGGWRRPGTAGVAAAAIAAAAAAGSGSAVAHSRTAAAG